MNLNLEKHVGVSITNRNEQSSTLSGVIFFYTKQYQLVLFAYLTYSMKFLIYVTVVYLCFLSLAG